MESTLKNKNVPAATKNKRSNKPLMEKKRRQRINTCLDMMKEIILLRENKDVSKYSKLEKADILEMAVNHLKKNPPTNYGNGSLHLPFSIKDFIAGFEQCASETENFMNRFYPNLNPTVSAAVAGHLRQVLQSFVPSTSTDPVQEGRHKVRAYLDKSIFNNACPEEASQIHPYPQLQQKDRYPSGDSQSFVSTWCSLPPSPVHTDSSTCSNSAPEDFHDPRIPARSSPSFLPLPIPCGEIKTERGAHPDYHYSFLKTPIPSYSPEFAIQHGISYPPEYVVQPAARCSREYAVQPVASYACAVQPLPPYSPKFAVQPHFSPASKALPNTRLDEAGPSGHAPKPAHFQPAHVPTPADGRPCRPASGGDGAGRDNNALVIRPRAETSARHTCVVKNRVSTLGRWAPYPKKEIVRRYLQQMEEERIKEEKNQEQKKMGECKREEGDERKKQEQNKEMKQECEKEDGENNEPNEQEKNLNCWRPWNPEGDGPGGASGPAQHE